MALLGALRMERPRRGWSARLRAHLPDGALSRLQAFLLEVLEQSAASLPEGHPEVPLDRLNWGEVSRS